MAWQARLVGGGGVCWEGIGICVRPEGGARTWRSSSSRCEVGHSPGLFEKLKEVLMA